jgi:hypothetical protein
MLLSDYEVSCAGNCVAKHECWPPVTRDGRQALEGKLDAIFTEVTAEWGAEHIRRHIANRGSNDWQKWRYESWLARHEGRVPPAEPSLFQAIRDAWWARKRQGIGGRA